MSAAASGSHAQREQVEAWESLRQRYAFPTFLHAEVAFVAPFARSLSAIRISLE